MGFLKNLFNMTPSGRQRDNNTITVICPLCGGKFDTNERALGCMGPCPYCGEQIVFNIVEGKDGSQEIHARSRLELQDYDAILHIARQQLQENRVQKREEGEASTHGREKHEPAINRLTRSELASLAAKIRKHRALYRCKQPPKILVNLCEDLILKEWCIPR